MDEFEKTIIEETAKQLPIRDMYNDVGKTTMKATGELVGLIPRAINAALLPLHQWILNKEYNIERTKQLLADKLQNIEVSNVVTPEPYIAIPAIQAISYCIDNDLLRNMYANLLASSMDKTVKDYVHPSFTEIIKQLTPDEAKVLNAIAKRISYPLLWVNRDIKNQEGSYYVIASFSLINDEANCEFDERIPEYLENLERLKLINLFDDAYLTAEGVYDEVSKHPNITKVLDDKTDEYSHSLKKGYCKLSIFGKSFHRICCEKDSEIIL